ncbi:MAG: hypothetical protein Q6I77_00760 [Gloeomargarita sp. DG_1_4_bins_134]
MLLFLPWVNREQGIVTLAASLAMQVVAEGIATPVQRWELKNLGVSKPVPEPVIFLGLG